jgi:hypothetical protein
MAGPATLVPEFMNLAWSRAVQMSDTASAKTNQALQLITTAPSADAPTAVNAPSLPAAPALSALTQLDATTLYDATAQGVINTLTGIYSDFLSTYFPEDAYIADAQDWVARALTVGGAGINTVVEAQLWGRARDRALTDANRTRESLEADWAARRFPLPPGALRFGSLAIHRSAQDAIAEAARSQASEGFKMEVENARIALDKAVSLRSLALSSAGEYIRTLSAGPQIAASVASMVVESQTRFSATMTDYYRAQLGAVEIPVRVSTTNAELKARTNEANLRAAMETITTRVGAVMANAQMSGTQAAAALNAIHTQASISGSDITTIEG